MPSSPLQFMITLTQPHTSSAEPLLCSRISSSSTGFAAHHERPGRAGHLVGERDRDDLEWSPCHVWTAPALQGKNLTLSASGSGAAIYTAFECGRCGRWP